MATIHSTAKVHPTAIIGDNVTVSEFAEIGPYCLIGLPPESLSNLDKDAGVLIGSYATLTGHVTVDSGTEQKTIIGSHSFLMKHVHIGHDALIGADCVIAPGAVVGGFVEVHYNVGIGINASIHQRLTIPSGCFIGAGSVLPRKWVGEAGMKYAGNPARCIGKNVRK